MSERDNKVIRFVERLLAEFPNWTTTEALMAAERIIDTAEQMQFQLEAEQGLAEIPTTEREAAA